MVSSTIAIGGELNIFIDRGRGGIDVLTGGSIACPFTGMPNAHTTGAKNVSPSIAPIGGWDTAPTASSPAYLGP
jgi:hypothetical protein